MARGKKQYKNTGSNYGTLRKYGLAGGSGVATRRTATRKSGSRG